MKKDIWNYIYSFLLSIILILLIAIFFNLTKDEYNIKNNMVNKKTLTNSGLLEFEQPISKSEKRSILLHDLIDQGEEEFQLFDRFMKDRKKEEPKAKVAIIIDDIGYQMEVVEQINKLTFPVAISILPFMPYSQLAAEKGKEKGLTVLLHLPMEPHDANINPGKGAIFTTMNEQEIRAKISANLKDIPNIDGVNNHMGSKATEDVYTMRIVLKELKERDLFFVDSRTSPNSIGYELSKEMDINAAQRDIFLDNEQNVEYIRNQVMALKGLALKNGYAIAIGHPYCNTITVLNEIESMLEPDGIEIVRLEELLE
ncbi:MAG: divergent polysaccharide deacetylase family protein [Candidatus Atribacteria bacterium]|nr:divergent polysaccharide deacetylase family protein [Candidatus Atribacteria bacterium]